MHLRKKKICVIIIMITNKEKLKIEFQKILEVFDLLS